MLFLKSVPFRCPLTSTVIKFPGTNDRGIQNISSPLLAFHHCSSLTFTIVRPSPAPHSRPPRRPVSHGWCVDPFSLHPLFPPISQCFCTLWDSASRPVRPPMPGCSRQRCFFPVLTRVIRPRPRPIGGRFMSTNLVACPTLCSDC